VLWTATIRPIRCTLCSADFSAIITIFYSSKATTKDTYIERIATRLTNFFDVREKHIVHLQVSAERSA